MLKASCRDHPYSICTEKRAVEIIHTVEITLEICQTCENGILAAGGAIWGVYSGSLLR